MLSHFQPRILLLSLFVILLYGCTQPTRKKERKEFEGIVTYKISYKDFADSALYGDTVKVYYSKGNILRVYNSTAERGVVKEIIQAIGSTYYVQTMGSDTLMVYDLKESMGLVMTSFTQNAYEKNILGYSCREIKTVHVHVGKQTYYLYESIIFSKEAMPVNSNHFKDWNFTDFNRVFEESGSFYLRYEMTTKWSEDASFGTKICEAIDIKEQSIDPKIFEIGNKPVKKLIEE